MDIWMTSLYPKVSNCPLTVTINTARAYDNANRQYGQNLYFDAVTEFQFRSKISSLHCNKQQHKLYHTQ